MTPAVVMKGISKAFGGVKALDNVDFQVLPGEGALVGPMVIDCSDAVMFTGSTAVGRIVAAQCAQRLISCSLELGGKNAMIVLDDADLALQAGG